MATVCVDPDDFTTDSNGRLQVKTTCDFVHTTNGLALSSDEARSAREQEIQDTDIAVPTSGTSIRVTPIVVAEITNPSTCRSMRVQVVEEAYHEVSVQPDGEVLIFHEREYNLGGTTVTRRGRHHVPAISNENNRFGAATTVTTYQTIAPGATLNVRFNLRAQHIADAASTTFTFGTVTLNMFGVLI